MNGSDFLENTWRVYRGKGETKTPIWGSEKANLVLSIANMKKNEFARDSDQTWVSLFSLVAPNEVGTVATAGTTTLTGTGTYFTDYQVGDTILVSGETVRTIATITSDTVLTVTVAFSTTASALTFTHQTIVKSGVQTYSLHRNFLSPSDSAVVTTTTQDITQRFAKPQRRDNSDLYISGLNPRKVTFYTEILSTDQKVGGELKVPAYYFPADIAATTDLVTVDDPNWLVYATAAELARNDPAKDTEFGNILGMANDLYRKMVSANNAIGFLQDDSMPYDMPMIGDQTGEF